MLRALSAVGRSLLPVAADGAAARAFAGPALTQRATRLFNAEPPDSGSSDVQGADEASGSGAGSSSGAGRPGGRPQTKEWRSWIDTKLDSKLEGMGEPAAAAAPPAPPTAPRGQGPKRGFELEKEIYSIVAPARAPEEGTLPEGVTTYAQLAMAGDAPRFARSGGSVAADLSPVRLHPTRIFFPEQTYGPNELDPYKTADSPAASTPWEQARALPPADQVSRYADYKNVPLLASFLSDTGKLPLRSRTKLRAKLHRRLAREIKTARCMGLLSPTAKWAPPVTAEETARQAAVLDRRQKLKERRQQQRQAAEHRS
ncbi:pectin lyase [Micractinium conductrix]|uniref:Small ribosomal subunit protein bS18c n=1 Tax=Micractinium conductrix TaxID=554055 RepID=A0A2P6VL30_9CHLO|nr:pectin lyase [Micractinium conductrix]|eukprot:PSC74785.1 pectin lyase [Micractinium conductrix]